MTLEELQPYISVFNTVISLAVLGVIFNLIKAHRETINERINALKDRLDGTKEDSDRKDKWFEREKAVLEKEKSEKEEKLKAIQIQLDEVLKKEGFTFESLALGQTLKESSKEVKILIEELSNKMTQQLNSITHVAQNDSIVSESQLTLAKAQMAKGDFDKAADNFGNYTSGEDTSWEVYFSKGISLANTRHGHKTDQASVGAYNEAINMLPPYANQNVRARIFAYRAAILKRLNRLDEAEADLNVAIKYADADYEKEDINYNLACVYSLKGERDKMIYFIEKLKSKSYARLVKNHMADYFEKYREDTELNKIINFKLGR